MPQAGKRKKVLFVDDERAFLDMIQRLAAQYGSDAWDVAVADSAGKALALLQSQPFDLVVLDVQMPVVDGVQFLGLIHRKYPQLQKVVLTGFANDQYRAACLSGGAELFLEKPRTLDGFEGVFATLRELTRWQPEDGFRGVLRRVGIPDIIQMECLSRHSVVLEVSTGDLKGELFICAGEIIHAAIAGKVGEAAFNHIIGLTSGEFKLKPFVEPPKRTIEGQWEFVLMEACRLRDEAGEANAPAEAAAPELAPAVTAPPELSVIPAPAPPPPAEAPGLARARCQVEEFLICSEQGDVLFEHQCPDTTGRVSVLEFVSQRTRQLAQALPLGRFERLEFTAAAGRAVVQLRSGCGVLVRVSRPG